MSPTAFIASQNHANYEKLATIAGDGTVLALTEVEAAAGQHVSLTSGGFASQEAAQRELESRVKVFSRILKRGPKKNDKGATVGERVLTLLHNRDPHRETYVVVWTIGRDFFLITASSLESALEGEAKVTSQTLATN